MPRIIYDFVKELSKEELAGFMVAMYAEILPHCNPPHMMTEEEAKSMNEMFTQLLETPTEDTPDG